MLLQVEAFIATINEAAKEYGEKKKEVDLKLKTFVTGILANTIKIS